jgi:ferredoxin
MIPEFSHRYGAVAAGIGRLGWSGNLITSQYGSALQIGTVLTSAKLKSDPLVKNNPCDRCMMCVASCPVEMIHKEEYVEVTIAGLTEKIAKKRSNNLCWLGCTGYHGLSPNKKWSTWSPYRTVTPPPLDDMEVDDLCTRIRRVDPDVNYDDLSLYTNYRESYFHPDLLFFSVCCNCANVCWENRKDRIENLRLLTKSGSVVLRANGERSAVQDENDIVEIETPFNLKVALLRKEYEAIIQGDVFVNVNKTHTLLDREVLRKLKR